MIELIGVLLLAIMPWLLRAITSFVKWATGLKYAPNKVFILRFILALLSFGVALLHSMIDGTPVPDTAIETFVEGLRVFLETGAFWLSTTGLYLLKKNKLQ